MSNAQMLELLKQLAAIDSNRCTIDGDIAEISCFPYGGSFTVSSRWSLYWDRLRCQVERWAISDGFAPASSYEQNTYIVRMQTPWGAIGYTDKDPAIATLAAYLNARTLAPKEPVNEPKRAS